MSHFIQIITSYWLTLSQCRTLAHAMDLVCEMRVPRLVVYAVLLLLTGNGTTCSNKPCHMSYHNPAPHPLHHYTAGILSLRGGAPGDATTLRTNAVFCFSCFQAVVFIHARVLSVTSVLFFCRSICLCLLFSTVCLLFSLLSLSLSLSLWHTHTHTHTNTHTQELFSRQQDRRVRKSRKSFFLILK